MAKLSTVAIGIAVVLEATAVILASFGLIPEFEANSPLVVIAVLIVVYLIVRFVPEADPIRRWWDGGFVVNEGKIRYFRMPPVETRERTQRVIRGLADDIKRIKESESPQVRDALLDDLNANLKVAVLTARDWNKPRRRALRELLQFAYDNFDTSPPKYLQTFWLLKFVRSISEDVVETRLPEKLLPLWEKAKKSGETDENYLTALVGNLLITELSISEFKLMYEVIYFPNDNALHALESAFSEVAKYLANFGQRKMSKMVGESFRKGTYEFLFKVMEEAGRKKNSEAVRRAHELRNFLLKLYEEEVSS